MTFYYVSNIVAIVKIKYQVIVVYFISVLRVIFIFGFETEIDLYIKNYLESTYFQTRYETTLLLI